MSKVVVKAPDVTSAARADTLPATARGRSSLVLRNTRHAVVPYLEYGARRLGRSGIVGLSLCIFSVIAFISGNAQLHRQLQAQSAELEAARASATRTETTGIMQSPQQRADTFLGQLPSRNDVPRIMTSLLAVASASGIELESGSYEFVAAGDDRISHYRISVPVKGSYPQIRQFVENTLATVPVLALDNLRIERDSVTQQVIEADLRFSLLLGEQT